MSLLTSPIVQKSVFWLEFTLAVMKCDKSYHFFATKLETVLNGSKLPKL